MENSLHGCLDVALENLAVIGHIAMSLLKQEATVKVGIKNKRLMAGWDNQYLAKRLDPKPIA